MSIVRLQFQIRANRLESKKEWTWEVPAALRSVADGWQPVARWIRASGPQLGLVAQLSKLGMEERRARRAPWRIRMAVAAVQKEDTWYKPSANAHGLRGLDADRKAAWETRLLCNAWSQIFRFLLKVAVYGTHHRSPPQFSCEGRPWAIGQMLTPFVRVGHRLTPIVFASWPGNTHVVIGILR